MTRENTKLPKTHALCRGLTAAVMLLGAAGCPESVAGVTDAGADAGQTAADAGSQATDAGAGTPDAGAGTPDAGVGTPDAGQTMDAGQSAPDAGQSAPDAGAVDRNLPDYMPSAPMDACSDDDPLTRTDWTGFCADRVDDNCTTERMAPDCTADYESSGAQNLCNTSDEPCPATQPGSEAPMWDCTGTAPQNVLAYALFTDSNAQVERFCAYVYESEVVEAEYWVAYTLQNGANTRGPDRKCTHDFSARRHLYFSDLDDGACPGVRYNFPDNVDNQKKSNACRKAIRNVARNDPNYDPDIQFFAGSYDEAVGKLLILDTAEIACHGIDNASTGQPYRPEEVWVTQASAPIVFTGN